MSCWNVCVFSVYLHILFTILVAVVLVYLVFVSLLVSNGSGRSGFCQTIFQKLYFGSHNRKWHGPIWLSIELLVCVCVCVCVCVRVYTQTLNFSSPSPCFMIGPTLKNRFRVRLQMSLGTIRLSEQTATTTLHELPSPHPFVL